MYSCMLFCSHIQLVGARVPVHIVSYNGTDPTMVVCLKELAQITSAR